MVWLISNGKLVEAGDARLSTDNRAFAYADGVFETIRLMYGQPLWLGWHFDRLSHGLRALGIQNPWHLTTFEKELLSLIEANKLRQGGRLKVQVWRSAGGFYTPESSKADWLMQVQPLPHNAFQLNYKGLQVGDASRPKQTLFIPDIKTNNALQYVLAAAEAKAAGLDDVFLYHAEGALLESSNSNVFILRDGILRTPALDGGCLPGIMRSVMLHLLPNMGYTVKEQLLSHADLQAADEVYLTNAIHGVRWVGGWKHKRYFRKQAVALNEALNQLALNSITAGY